MVKKKILKWQLTRKKESGAGERNRTLPYSLRITIRLPFPTANSGVNLRFLLDGTWQRARLGSARRSVIEILGMGKAP